MERLAGPIYTQKCRWRIQKIIWSLKSAWGVQRAIIAVQVGIVVVTLKFADPFPSVCRHKPAIYKLMISDIMNLYVLIHV